MTWTRRCSRPGVRIAIGAVAWLTALTVSWWFWPDVPPVVWSLSLVVSAVAVAASVRPPSRHVTATALAIATVASLTSTVGWLYTARLESGAWVYLQTIALLLLITMAVRRCPPVTAAVTVAAAVVADAVLAVQIMGPQLPVGRWFGACLFWAIGAAGAIGFGFYLRGLDIRATAAVAAARRTQRHQLARDLHDFVAHDVSGMVLQAQAAQAVLNVDPPRAEAALRRIEADGTRALSSMDRSIQLLRTAEPGDGSGPPPASSADGAAATAVPFGPDTEDVAGVVAVARPSHERGPAFALPASGVAATPVPGLADLAGLVERFATGHAGPVALRLDHHPGDVPRDLGTVMYRVAVEALTNVRRHASAYCRVDVAVSVGTETGRAVVECVIANTVTAGRSPLPSAHGRGGVGLAALAEQVGALGGTFAAGPDDGDATTPDPGSRWTVNVALPLPAEERT